MPVTDLHRQVAAIALQAAGKHRFALAGGNAAAGSADLYPARTPPIAQTAACADGLDKRRRSGRRYSLSSKASRELRYCLSRENKWAIAFASSSG